MSVAGIILAAGSSRRLGLSKQEVMLAGETLLQRAIRTAGAAGLLPVVVVIRDRTSSSAYQAPEVEFVINENPDEGIASSIRCGIAALSSENVTGAIIMTCDQPTVTAPHLRSLHAGEHRMTGSRYEHGVGVPAYFPRTTFPELLRLSGDSGARALLRTAHSIPAANLQLDIDTPEDLERARVLFEGGSYSAS